MHTQSLPRVRNLVSAPRALSQCRLSALLAIVVLHLFACGRTEHGVEEQKEVAPPTVQTSEEAIREINLGDMIAQLTPKNTEDPPRYAKLGCTIWMHEADARNIFAADQKQVERRFQVVLEDRLKKYTIEQISEPGIAAKLSEDFSLVLEEELRLHHPGRPIDEPFIQRIVLRQLLVQ